jgi:hypothetical protein
MNDNISLVSAPDYNDGDNGNTNGNGSVISGRASPQGLRQIAIIINCIEGAARLLGHSLSVETLVPSLKVVITCVTGKHEVPVEAIEKDVLKLQSLEIIICHDAPSVNDTRTCEIRLFNDSVIIASAVFTNEELINAQCSLRKDFTCAIEGGASDGRNGLIILQVATAEAMNTD